MLTQQRVFRYRPRVRRQQLRLVAPNGRHHTARDEVRRIIEQPDELIDHPGHLDRDGSPGALAVREEKHRHGRMPLAQLVQQRGGLRMRALAVLAEFQSRSTARSEASEPTIAWPSSKES